MRSITIIIPVYNAFDVTLDCIQSVLRTIPRRVRVCVIDDASPSGDLREFLPAAVLRDKRVSVLRNERNLGFVGTCNRGMLIESTEDVILLNSDTVVTSGWVQKLHQAAYSRPRVGTVTPLTNNGTICSVPRFLENNALPDGVTLEGFSKLVEEVSTRDYVEAPTCVGFCTYIRRELIDEVGVFDPVFKQGYGEENDLSLRGNEKGFFNIIDDATYIFHRGNMSFQEMRESLSEANTKILTGRFPHYEKKVAQFCQSNPLKRVHARIWNALIAKAVRAKGKAVLHILHNGPFEPRRHSIGGTELHVQGIIQKDSATAHFSLTPGDGGVVLTAHLSSGERLFKLPHTVVPSLFTRDFFSVIHLHHAAGFDLPTIADGLLRHNNYVVSVHDYHLVCGRLWLVKKDLSVCDGVSCEVSCFQSQAEARSQRELAQQIFDSAQKILVFSNSTRKLLSAVVGEHETLQVTSHGIDQEVRDPIPVPSRPNDSSPLRVLCLGTLVSHKGSRLVKEAAAQLTRIDDIQIEWHLLGQSEEEQDMLKYHGRYLPGNLREKIAEIAPHVVLLAPQCQETYSSTLDEAVWYGIPIMCSPFGALPERVEAWGVGYVFDNTVAGICSVLKQIVNNWDDYIRRRQATHVAPIRSVTAEAHELAGLYGALSADVELQGDALVRFLQPDLVGPEPVSLYQSLAIKFRELESTLKEGLR